MSADVSSYHQVIYRLPDAIADYRILNSPAAVSQRDLYTLEVCGHSSAFLYSYITQEERWDVWQFKGRMSYVAGQSSASRIIEFYCLNISNFTLQF